MRPWQRHCAPRTDLVFGTLWLVRRGLGYKQEKAIKGQEGPDLQVHVWSAWFPTAHWARTDTCSLNLSGQVPSEGSGPVTWRPRQALGIPPPVHSAARTTLSLGSRDWRQPQCSPRSVANGSRPPMSQGYRMQLRSSNPRSVWNMKEAKIKTTFKVCLTSLEHLFPGHWLRVRLCLPMPHRSVSSKLFKDLCHILFKIVLLTFTIIIFSNYKSETYS